MEIPTVEEMHKQIYESAKSMFEQCMFIMFEKIQSGNLEEARKIRETLITNYNNSCDGNVRLLAKVRELEGK